MSDATIAWLCSEATYNIEAIYYNVQQKFKEQINNLRLLLPPFRNISAYVL